MAQEIERKFLVSGEFKSLATKALTIKQGYLCANAGRTVRVRVRDNQGFLTIKGRSDAAGLSRFEWEKDQRPEWLGEEVTGDRRYYNAYLSKHPFTTW